MLLKDLYPANIPKEYRPNSWRDVARKSNQESKEFQLLQRMSFGSKFTILPRPLWSSLENWIAKIKLHLWSVHMNEKESCLQNIYRIKVKETLNRSIANLFGDMAILPQENGETVLVGSFIDQPALRGLLDRLWNLNITILSVERIGDQKAVDSAPGA
ncbi:MAG: hypothetical protein ACM3PY_20665 [Omnitrophica WOR_2 bacterium]